MPSQIQTQTNVLKREIKDLDVSHKEYDQEVKRMETIDKEDNFRVNQQNKVIEMAQQSIKDARDAIEKTVKKVEQLQKELAEDPTVEESLLTEAAGQVEIAKNVLSEEK